MKDKKEFRVEIEGSDTEKVHLPIYRDESRDETLLILVKEFNLMVKDKGMLREDIICPKTARNGFTVV